MLRFFRQIRHRLLIDNRFSKYLVYAVGEILLVVIGILIALQIDNWNEKRQEDDKIKAQLVNLVRDLKLDRNGLNELRGFHAFRVHAAYYLLNQYNGSDRINAYPEAGEVPELNETGIYGGPIPDTLDKAFVVRGFSWLVRSNPINPSTDAIEEFKSTGLFALYENQDIKNNLRTYYTTYSFVFPKETSGEPNSIQLKNSLSTNGYSYLDVALLENPVEELLSYPANVALLKNIIDESTYRSNSASEIGGYLDDLILAIEEEIDN